MAHEDIDSMSSLESVTDYCPYCGETIRLIVDPPMAGQAYYEDCEVCCRPILCLITIVDGHLSACLKRDDD